MKRIVAITIVAQFFMLTACNTSVSENRVAFVEGQGKIDVLVDGKAFTSFITASEYLNKTVTKPILFPVRTPSGLLVTRSFPYAEVAGESQDHPHHTGIFFTYDQVNGNGFWNNTEYPPQIKTTKVTATAPGDTGLIKMTAEWIGKDLTPILREERAMLFIPGENETAIDFTMTLTALVDQVNFGDTKEGMFAIRVAHELQEDFSGHYTSSNGDMDEKEVWGRRAQWVKLEGQIDNSQVGIAIFNHPTSINYPTFWHTRGYGLFSANPLGQLVFERDRGVENPTPFHLTLEKGASAVFKFRLLVYDGERSKDVLDAYFAGYAQ